MQSKALECPVCYQEFNLTECLPLIIPHCGHTVCQKCLKFILQEIRPFCPLDKNKIKYRELKKFPVNFSLLNVLEENSEWDRCRIDNEKIEFVCLSDNCKVCKNCWHYSQHKGHITKTSDEIKTDVEKKREELETASLNLEEYYKKIDNMIDEKKAQIEMEIQNHFDEWDLLLKAKKLSLLYELDCYFNYERHKLDLTLGRGFNLRNEINEKITQFKKFFTMKNPFHLLDEDVHIMIERAKNVLAKQNYIQVLKNRTQEISAEFTQTFEVSKAFMEEFENMYKNLEEKPKTMCPELSEGNNKLEKEKVSPCLEVNTSLKFQSSIRGLEIDFSSPIIQKVELKPNEWKDETLVLRLKNNMRINKEKLLTLSCIKNSIQGFKNITLIIENYQKSYINFRSDLTSLFSAIYGGKNELKKIIVQFDLGSEIPSDDLLLLIAEKVLPKLKEPLKIHLDLGNTSFSDKTMELFVKKAQPILKNETELVFRLNEGLLSTKTINQIRELPCNVQLSKFEVELSEREHSPDVSYEYVERLAPYYYYQEPSF